MDISKGTLTPLTWNSKRYYYYSCSLCHHTR